jgi:DNA helicase-2/ATP-dependent DNA helicase PcrA
MMTLTGFDRFSRSLKEFKIAKLVLDYTDVLETFVQRNSGPSLDVLIVDEAQDLSYIQWMVISILAKTCRRVVIAGDDDQAIYRWAGADVETLLYLEGKVEVLDQSWRVPQKIQKVADTIISRVRHRRLKVWNPRPVPGIVTRLNDINDIDWKGNSVLMLARNQYLLFGIMDSLRSAGVLFMHHGFPSVKQSYLDGIVAWERMRSGTQVSVPEARKALDLITTGKGVKRGNKTLKGYDDQDMIGMQSLRDDIGVTVEGIWHEALDKIPLVERMYMVRCRRNGERFSLPPRVRIDTIHASKGGEADKVIILPDMATRTYAESLEHPEDEARVWYVGVTRAKEELCVLNTQSPRSMEL